MTIHVGYHPGSIKSSEEFRVTKTKQALEHESTKACLHEYLGAGRAQPTRQRYYLLNLFFA